MCFPIRTNTYIANLGSINLVVIGLSPIIVIAIRKGMSFNDSDSSLLMIQPSFIDLFPKLLHSFLGA